MYPIKNGVSGYQSLHDPFFSSVAILMHMDGTNGSTTFIDSSSHNFAITPSAATITTAQSKFSGASGDFTSNGSATFTSSAALGVGTGDFTLEIWFRIASLANCDIFTFQNVASGSFAMLMESNGALTIVDGASYLSHGTAGLIATNTWTHLAVDRVGTTIRTAVSGVVDKSFSYSLNPGNSPKMGVNSTGFSACSAFFDDFRFTNGVGRFSSNFSVPTLPYPNF